MEAAMDAAVRRAMAHADFATKFKHPIKFNGTDFVETKMSEDEQFAQLRKLLSAGSLHVFLERYGAMLEEQDLDSLSGSPAAETAEAQIWLHRLRSAPPSESQLQKRARRRRWTWAKRQMVEASGFFSEDVMKHRDPKLFHELIGKHNSEPTSRVAEPMKGSLSSYLMQRLDQECGDAGAPAEGAAASAEAGGVAPARKRKREEEGGEGGDKTPNGEENLSEDEGSIADGGENADEIDITARRAQFLKSMRDRFVNGTEKDFTYEQIDADSDLDDLTELGQDAEDKYFDDE